MIFLPSLNVLKKQNLNVDTRMTLVISDDDEFELYEIFGLIHRRKSVIQAIRVGNWNSTNFHRQTCRTNSYGFRKNLQGVRLWSSISVS